ncbi:MAG TPA: DUF4241 domain-containing protein [Polyangiaceae bacterium]|nr:DUF4241 domain-containing protein [Polyangiaceae bacterium]
MIDADLLRGIAAKLAATEPEEVLLRVPSGRLALGDPDALPDCALLDRRVPAGSHAVSIHRSDEDFDASPTVGIDAVEVRFSSAPVVRWVEAKSEIGASLFSDDLIAFCVGEAAALEDDAVAEQTRQVLEDCMVDGSGFAGAERALVVYVGEVAISHHLYWGLDEGGAPVQLLAVFDYPGR